jgi:hypothetical protein
VVVTINLPGEAAFSFTVRGKANVKGDINGDSKVDFADALLAMQVNSGMNPPGVRPDYAHAGVDVNGDRRIGPEEAVYILQKIGATR